ncbi:MAG: carbon storage regulator [Oscillospiraceae bacterium]|nr:carbon storage regulator [Oscillospiraceae bacterium]
MLKLTLLPEEYLTIGDSIVVQLIRVAGGRADLAVEAPRSVPIIRGAVLERSGGQRPACLAPPSGKKAKYFRDQVFRWNDDRERAVRVMKQVFDRLEQSGAAEEAKLLRTQLDRIIPAFWEEDLAAHE